MVGCDESADSALSDRRPPPARYVVETGSLIPEGEDRPTPLPVQNSLMVRPLPNFDIISAVFSHSSQLRPSPISDPRARRVVILGDSVLTVNSFLGFGPDRHC